MGQIAACANHSDREAMGICVRCGKLVCTECVTRLDGINHCVSCLLGLRKADAAGPRATADRTTLLLRLALSAALLALGLWGIFEATLPG